MLLAFRSSLSVSEQVHWSQKPQGLHNAYINDCSKFYHILVPWICLLAPSLFEQQQRLCIYIIFLFDHFLALVVVRIKFFYINFVYMLVDLSNQCDFVRLYKSVQAIRYVTIEYGDQRSLEKPAYIPIQALHSNPRLVFQTKRIVHSIVWEK